MKEKVFYIPSSNGTDRLHCILWTPDEGQPVRALVQVSHGMVEYIRRYEPMARALTQAGIAVAGHDHLGHGETAPGPDRLGFFAESGGDKAVLRDIRRVGRAARRLCPQVPHILMGHSMGSFFARRCVALYGGELDGAIFMGTGWVPYPLAQTGVALSEATCRTKGPMYRSRMLFGLTIGSYNRDFEAEGRNAWLSRDREQVRLYNEDPFCNFRFTASAYLDFFRILRDLSLERGFAHIPADLPMIFLSGAEDPVGGKGEGVTKAWDEMKRLGVRDVKLKLYGHDRHELVHELDSDQVFRDIIAWVEEHI